MQETNWKKKKRTVNCSSHSLNCTQLMEVRPIPNGRLCAWSNFLNVISSHFLMNCRFKMAKYSPKVQHLNSTEFSKSIEILSFPINMYAFNNGFIKLTVARKQFQKWNILREENDYYWGKLNFIFNTSSIYFKFEYLVHNNINRVICILSALSILHFKRIWIWNCVTMTMRTLSAYENHTQNDQYTMTEMKGKTAKTGWNSKYV